MFDFKHYVPVLRWKTAEKEALEKLNSEEKRYITPLLELIMPPAKYTNGQRVKYAEELLSESIEVFKTKIPTVSKEILKFWGNEPVFIDVSLIDSTQRATALHKILSDSKELELNIIPVVSLVSSEQVVKATTISTRGVGLRLFRIDLDNTNLSNEIETFLSKSSLTEEQVDLIIDLQVTGERCLEINDLIKYVPNILNWRTMAIISGKFPKDLTEFTVDLHKIERSDWKCWFKQIKSGESQRKPAFGDYTIQHPIYSEPAPGANPSASIRYTLNEEWLIMRGRGLRSRDKDSPDPGHAQYPAQAKLLLGTEEFKVFGKEFSFGDSYISEIGKDVNSAKTGNPRTWLRAGINHHLVCVVSQIAKLP